MLWFPVVKTACCASLSWPRRNITVITMERTSVKFNKGPQQELSRFHFCECFDDLEPFDFKILLLLLLS